MKRKILIITQRDVLYVTGGTTTVFCNFCNMLSKNGYKVTGACYSQIEGMPNGLTEDIQFINLNGYKNMHSYEKAINLFICDYLPDLIIFFYPKLYVSANLHKRFDNIPRILMFHSRPDVYFAEKTSLASKLKRKMKNTVSQILCDSFWSLLPDFMKQQTVVTIPNCVDINHQNVNLEHEKKRIIYLSRVDACKGVEFLINSFKLISHKYPDWQIHIYGHSRPENYVRNLQDLTKRLGIDKQIIFKGITKTPFTTFLDYDFCVFPSFFEGFAMGLIEAMSVGLPAVGVQICSGVNEVIEDEYNGFLTPMDYQSYANKIEQLIINKNLRIKLGNNAIKTAQCYDTETVNQMWNDVINKILSGDMSSLQYRNQYSESKYDLMPIENIMQLNGNVEHLSIKQKIFSVRTIPSQSRKIFTIFGINIKIRTQNTTT